MEQKEEFISVAGTLEELRNKTLVARVEKTLNEVYGEKAQVQLTFDQKVLAAKAIYAKALKQYSEVEDYIRHEAGLAMYDSWKFSRCKR